MLLAVDKNESIYLQRNTDSRNFGTFRLLIQLNLYGLTFIWVKERESLTNGYTFQHLKCFLRPLRINPIRIFQYSNNNPIFRWMTKAQNPITLTQKHPTILALSLSLWGWIKPHSNQFAVILTTSQFFFCWSPLNINAWGSNNEQRPPWYWKFCALKMNLSERIGTQECSVS